MSRPAMRPLSRSRANQTIVRSAIWCVGDASCHRRWLPGMPP
jgi:hypothetical protein